MEAWINPSGKSDIDYDEFTRETYQKVNYWKLLQKVNYWKLLQKQILDNKINVELHQSFVSINTTGTSVRRLKNDVVSNKQNSDEVEADWKQIVNLRPS